jgi:uncharacterized protein (DUF305 family)
MSRIRHQAAGLLLCALATLGVTPLVQAEQPGRGITAAFEVGYLRFIIDHHFAALRMTELAAGADPTRSAPISADEGTSPTPNAAPAVSKASIGDIKSIARGANRMQREEILRARTFLRQWYGIDHQPRVRGVSRRQIELLESASPGRPFDQMFLMVFSRHHYIAATRSVECLAGRELGHHELRNYCDTIVQAQLNQIDDMRHLLCREFSICDYQPLSGLRGRFSGDSHPEWQKDSAED